MRPKLVPNWGGNSPLKSPGGMTEKKLYKVYDESDVEVVYRRGDWQDRGQMRRWVEREGERDNELTLGGGPPPR
ncbi:hypothetical protein SAMN05216266_14516 [Amycolatopsis marina]|uniref:Uncharacterized protein n=3 Tax=Pseudonocardiales TaxID=85010 RepID=A0A1I1CPM9_9PSEU|nr:hypothetical protein [Amycolatopsis roodepoortensis]TWE14995.1 hypothetical protein FHX69_7165 [Prauserella muralis]SDU62808.1 hypothetical protein SAMN04489733_7282 [Amycolatopsis keratiniphila]SFB64611.1 hypothetical protein SAMN05216266_14516 [Amycolatopsis marina]